MRGADLLVRTLAASGVQHLFALSGNQIMSVFDACIDTNINIVHTRHEAATVHAAEAYAQISGSIGVALVTAGAGACNTAGALFGASESETPVLLISGDSPVAQDGKGAFQELDQVVVTTALTRWSHRVTSVDELEAAIKTAYQLAHAPRPGPVHLVIPDDILKQQLNASPSAIQLTRDAPDKKLINRIALALDDAKQPLLLTGSSLTETRQPELFKQLGELFKVPVVSMESPRGLNDPKLGDFKTVIKEADVIVSLGKRVDFSIGFGNTTDADWYAVLADDELFASAANNLKGKLKLGVIADPVASAEQLATVASGETPDRSEWMAQVKHCIDTRAELSVQTNAITPVSLCSEVQQAINRAKNAILICDGGEFGQWSQACLNAPKRVINGLSGSIGGGIGYGIGAAIAEADASVFVLTGDGSVGFHLAEIETAARAGAAITIVIGNDSRWNAEHQLQKNTFGEDRLIACELNEMRYENIALAVGGVGRGISTVEELRDALRSEDHGRVTCLNVKIEGLAAPVV